MKPSICLTKWYAFILFLIGFCFTRVGSASGQELQRHVADSKRQELRALRALPVVANVAPVAVPGRRAHLAPAAGPIANAAAKPDNVAFNPATGPAGTAIAITGSNFDMTVKVYFGGAEARSVTITDAGHLTATVGAGASGPVKVTNSQGSFTTTDNFTFIPPPTITQVIPADFTEGATITLLGTGFTNATTVSIDGTPATGVVFGSATTITATVNGPVTSKIITVNDPHNGGSVFPPNSGGSGVGGNADFTLPGVGDQVLVIPTPTFTYIQPHPGKVFSFEVKVWGNSLGTDSSIQRVANKLLLPQTSILGMQGEFNWAIVQADTSFILNVVADVNFLLKKISYLDTTGKNNFNPWAFHPRIGLAATFWNNNVYAGFYYNFMNILTNYDQFKAFFQCGNQNVFVYPEANVGALFPIGGNGKQRLKFELDGIFNNKDVNKLYNQYSGMIISVKAGFVTTF